MLSRRKMFGWVAGLVGTVASVPALASTRLREMVDAGMYADFPGSLVARASKDATSAEFVRLQAWFREHPELLWASPQRSKMSQLVMRAQQLAQPFMEANVRPDASFGLDAWCDTITDNLLLKGRLRLNMDKEVGQRGPVLGVGYCFPARDVLDKSVEELEPDINVAWEALTDALHQRPIPTQFVMPDGGATWFTRSLDEIR